MIFNERLKYIRKYNHNTQEQLANLLDVDRTTVAKMESGTNSPNIDTVLKISKIYGVSTDYLLGLKNYSEYTWSLSSSYSMTPEDAEKLLLRDTDEDMVENLNKLQMEYSNELQEKYLMEELNEYLKKNACVNSDDFINSVSKLINLKINPDTESGTNTIIKLITHIEDYSKLLELLTKLPTEAVSNLEKFITTLITTH